MIYMLAAWPSGNARRFIVETMLEPNCDRSWITAATLVAEVVTRKSATSRTSHYCRSF